MKSAVLNVSIDTETPEGERIRDLILGGDNKNGWLCVAWIDRTKYNPVELLKQSEEARMKAVEEAIRLNGEVDKMAAWIEKAVDLMVYNELHDPNYNRDDPSKFAKIIDEAPI
jgi:hypothetical protein